MANLSTEEYKSMQGRITELETRIQVLEKEKMSSSSSIQIEEYLPFENKINIVDFSPEWDYTKGGTKVIICINKPLINLNNEFNKELRVYFGEVSVPGIFIQPGVIKCYGI